MLSHLSSSSPGVADTTYFGMAFIWSAKGSPARYATRDGDALTTVSVCGNSAGAEETTRRAAAFVQEILPGTTVSPPRVTTGEVILTF
ncbi:MAG: hypothetical protein H0W14_13060 [Actinobacteria bacterium]|nr:hypothetical protein [Actinomycetota bacterium]